MKSKLKQYNEEISGFTAEEIILWSLKRFGREKLVLSSSLSLEDQILTAMLINAEKNARIFILDTCRNFQETYDVMHETMEKYSIRYEVYYPDTADLEELANLYGPNFIYESIEKRKLCCEIRKLRPLKRALAGSDAWICGLRRSQSVTRELIEPVEWDDNSGIFKINPLYNWEAGQVRDYIIKNEIPYNRLYEKGYTSIGCAPCTRAVLEGEDERAGRWWWETAEKRECGLHNKKTGVEING